MQSRDALQFGQDALRMDPNAVSLKVAGMSPEQLGQAQIGLRSGMMTRANDVRDVSNPWEATLGNPNQRARIDALYPDNPGNQSLFDSLGLERQMANTRYNILGNSKTAGNIIADQAFADPGNLPGKALQYGLAVKSGGLSALAHSAAPDALLTAWKLGLGRKAIQKADELAPALFNTDPNAIKASIDDLLQRMGAYSNFVKASRPTRSLGMFGAGLGDAANSAHSGY
jgi:hypothetical protein